MSTRADASVSSDSRFGKVDNAWKIKNAAKKRADILGKGFQILTHGLCKTHRIESARCEQERTCHIRHTVHTYLCPDHLSKGPDKLRRRIDTELDGLFIDNLANG